MLTHPLLEQDYKRILLPVLILFRDVDPPLAGNNCWKLLMSFALKNKEEQWHKKPIAMEQLKQILQEIARPVRISRNSVRKYLSRCDTGTDTLSDKQLADEAYNNEQLQTNTQRKLQLLEHG